jgi:hypothetical protein
MELINLGLFICGSSIWILTGRPPLPAASKGKLVSSVAGLLQGGGRGNFFLLPFPLGSHLVGVSSGVLSAARNVRLFPCIPKFYFRLCFVYKFVYSHAG